MDLFTDLIRSYVFCKDSILGYFSDFGVTPNDFEYVIFSLLLMIIPVVIVWLSFKLIVWFFKL